MERLNKYFNAIMNEDTSAIIKAVANSIEAIKATQKLQPQLDLGRLIDASERLLTALKDPNTTVEQLALIQNEIETINKEKGWQ